MSKLLKMFTKHSRVLLLTEILYLHKNKGFKYERGN